MNDFDLTPKEIKKQYPENVVKELRTFKTQGVSELEADAYLNTEDGKLYFKKIREFDQKSSFDDLYERALGQLTSGSELPRMETINEPLVKIVPKGVKPTDYTPFWCKESDLAAAMNEGKNLSKFFGLPITSESPEYDVYRITPKQPTQVFINHVAPTSELDGLITKPGGAVQYIVPNRQLFHNAEYTRITVENRNYIPHQKELQIPSDLKNPHIQTVGGIPRSELAQMNDELIKRGYTAEKAFEATSARATVNAALEEASLRHTSSLPENLAHSQTTLRQAATVLHDSQHAHALNRQVAAANALLNGDTGLAKSIHTAHSQPRAPETPFQQAHRQALAEPAPEPNPSHKAMHQHINAVTRSEQRISAAYQAEQAATRQAEQAAYQAEIKSVIQTAEMPRRGVPLGSVAAVGLIAADGADILHNVEQTARSARTTHDQYTQGGAEAVSGVARAALRNSAALAAGAATIETSPAGSLAAAAAAGVAADKAYQDSALDHAMRSAGHAVGKAAYGFTDEAKLKTAAGHMRAKFDHMPDGAAKDLAREDLRLANQAYHAEREANQTLVDAKHLNDATYEAVSRLHPKYPIGRDTLDQHIGQAMGKGLQGDEAVKAAWSAAVAEQQHKDREALAKLTPQDRQAAVHVFENNPGATVDSAIRLVDLKNSRGMTTMGGAPIGENMYKEARARMEEANHQADPTYGRDRNDRLNEQNLKARDSALASVTDTLTHARNAQWAQEEREWYARQKKVQEVTDLMDAARNGRLPPLKQEHAHGPHHAPAPEMGIGAHGQNVRHVQDALNALGAHIRSDGHYSQETAAAVKAFQHEHHLKADGTLGVKDVQSIRHALQNEAHHHQTHGHEAQHAPAPHAATHTRPALSRHDEHQISELREFMLANKHITPHYSHEQIDNMAASLYKDLCAQGKDKFEIQDVAIDPKTHKLGVYYDSGFEFDRAWYAQAQQASQTPQMQSLMQIPEAKQEYAEQQNHAAQQQVQARQQHDAAPVLRA